MWGSFSAFDLRTRKRIHKLAQDYGIDQESRFLGKASARTASFAWILKTRILLPLKKNGDNEIKSK